MVDDLPGLLHELSHAHAIKLVSTAGDGPVAELPGVCQPGECGRLHTLSESHARLTRYDEASRELIERGTCSCGRYVARFAFEGQPSETSRVPFFPVDALAAVVAGLAPEPLGPHRRSGVDCEWCGTPDVTGEAHWCPAILGPAADGDDLEHERIISALAQVGWSNVTDQQLAMLAATDPFGAGDMLRGARVLTAQGELTEFVRASIEDQRMGSRNPWVKSCVTRDATSTSEPALAELDRALRGAGQHRVWAFLLIAAGVSFLAIILMAM